MKIGTMTYFFAACMLCLVIQGMADSYGPSWGQGIGKGYASYGGSYGYGSYPYYPYYGFGQRRGFGNGAFLALIGFLFIILFLFGGFFNTTSNTGSTTVNVVGK